MTARRPPRLSWIDAAIAFALAWGYGAILVRSCATVGYARDEGFYFGAASSYGRWFELLFTQGRAAFDARSVDVYWGANHEHPGLVKSLFALSNMFLQKRWHLFAMEGTSYRFPAIALGALGIGLVYVWGAQARSRAAGLVAAILLAAMPRFFFQAHLACFDVPIVTMWTLAAYAYWRALRDGGPWPLLAGLFFGLALDTKHNAWFLPFLVVGHRVGCELLFAIERRVVRRPDDGERARLFAQVRRRGLAALTAMATVGPLVFYALWPWIWRDTLHKLHDYASFHLHHEYYNMEFLGQNYWTPPMPRAYLWVMTAATVPGVTLLLFFVGIAGRARAHLGRARSNGFDPTYTGLLWALGFAVNTMVWLSPNTPIFGGTKHWMTAYPFVALFAGAGFDAVVRAGRRELLRRRARRSLGGSLTVDWARRAGRASWPVAVVFGAAVIVAPLAETAHSHPWGLSAYTPLVGGSAGAATLGLNRTFWGYATGSVVDYLNRDAPPRASVYVHDTAGASWDMLLADGRVRRDLHGVGALAGASYSLYHHEMHMRGQEFQAWVAYGTARPDDVAGIDGVPVIHVYKQR